MEVVINQQAVTIKPQSSLMEVLCDYGITQAKGIAVAVNAVVIPPQKWDGTMLNPNDKIIIIKATQGG
ncbi:sulfur carrier protein ThiS [Parapedobacter tibetensis]|uniref:sulfur carrier protein ThiS n=1 Tax=Parapedobacter tibetensis TaxID=2972951 RepID=UPI00214D9EDD|nr:sulfur carrier protein ThiS [Parapedobacter tibetensis]